MRQIVEAVHAKGSFIYMQLWALGRAAEPSVLENEGPYPYVSASDVTHPERKFPPRPLTTEGTRRNMFLVRSAVAQFQLITEVKQYVKWYAQAAANAVHGAGFDGIEIHGANGYLVDQFIQDVTNKRTDEYGGSIENRARFALEVIDAIVEKIGPERTGIRLSPWGNYGGECIRDLPVLHKLMIVWVDRYEDDRTHATIRLRCPENQREATQLGFHSFG